MNKKSLLNAFLTAIILSGLILVSTVQFSTVQASTEVTGIIYSDTTWTKANSPYSLKGPVGVSEGVTLTIEPGTTVNLNDHYIIVNGTLRARGSNTDKIYFNDGSIALKPISKGSIIENAVGNDEVGTTGSHKITKSSFNEIWIYDGDSTISYNTIGRIVVRHGAPSISNNNISGKVNIEDGSPSINDNTIDGRIKVNSGSPIISNNKLFDGIDVIDGEQVTIFNNELISKNDRTIISVTEVNTEISSNRIMGNGKSCGISIDSVSSSVSISDNQIYGCATGITASANVPINKLQITRNVIFDNEIGLYLGGNGSIVQDNTIARNTVGIKWEVYASSSANVTNNNIQDNSQYNFRLKAPNDITVANNWWGTTDTQAINQTIYDSKYDFNVGTVNFVPFLTEANPEAPVVPSVPTSTPTPTPSQEPQQTGQEILIGVAIAAAVIVAGLGLLIYLIKRK